MSEGMNQERPASTGGGGSRERTGPGRWLLTGVGIFSMVLVTAVIFIVAAFWVAN